MTERFAVRRTPQGYGVWDAAVNGWHSRQDLAEAQATDEATTMNARYATQEPRGDTTSRKVLPPRPVLVLLDGRWWPGHLDWWVREADGWYGRAVLDESGASNWYPAGSLKPADGAPAQESADAASAQETAGAVPAQETAGGVPAQETAGGVPTQNRQPPRSRPR